MADERLKLRQSNTLSSNQVEAWDAPRARRGVGLARASKVQQTAAAAKLKAERLALRAERAAGIIPVPAWVPDYLTSTFENVAWIRGEHEAAAIIRQMKGLRP